MPRIGSIESRRHAADRRDAISFVTVGALGLGVVPFGTSTAGALAVVVGLAATAVAIALSMLHRHSAVLRLLPALLYLVCVTIARSVVTPEMSISLTPLVVVPILWIALHGRRLDILVVSMGVVVALWLPGVVADDLSPAAIWRAVLYTAVALVLAPVIQRIVRRLDESRDAARVLVEHAPYGVAVLDEHGIIAQANTPLASFSGIEREQLLGSSFGDLAADGAQAFGPHLTTALRDGHAEMFEWRLASRTDGVRDVVLTLVRVEGGDEAEVVVHVFDLSEQSARRRELEYLAHHDTMSGLRNRRGFERVINSLIASQPDGERDGGVLLIDLDRFKHVNDVLGHVFGDQLIAGIGSQLVTIAPESATVARIGGDEFAIVVPSATEAELDALAIEAGMAIAQYTDRFPDARSHVTASIGGVTLRRAEELGENPLELADQAMYSAKLAGRGRHSIVPAKSEPPLSSTRVQLMLDDERLELVVQPIADLATGEWVAGEALARLRVGGELLPPSRFIPTLERAGGIAALDLRMLDLGVGAAARLRSAAPAIRLHVNLSARSLDIVTLEALRQALTKHGVEGAALVIEVTETSEIRDLAKAREFGEAVHALGCGLALDDFGEGYANLRALTAMDFDLVKLPRDIMVRARAAARDRQVLRGMAEFAASLGLQTAAEYLSDEATFDAARDAGIGLGQGTYVAPTMSVQACWEELSRRG